MNIKYLKTFIFLFYSQDLIFNYPLLFLNFAMENTLRFSSEMIVKGHHISMYMQAAILSLFAQQIHRDEIAAIISTCLECSRLESLRIVDSVLGVCIRDI
jgi:hypothetical protein